MNPQLDAKRDYEFRAVQKIPSVSLKFDWTIENYNVEKRDGCESPEIELPDVTLSFHLARCDPSLNRVNYEMLRVRSNSLAIFLTGRISINGTKHSFSRKMTSKDEMVLKILEIVSPSAVEIRFDLRVFYLDKKNVVLTKKKYEAQIDRDRYCQQLQDYVQTLWRNPQFSDVRIEVGGDSILAHKTILSARSPVFARMFHHYMNVENTENVVYVEDVPFDVLERLMGFLYGVSPEVDDIQDLDVLYKLYYASDKYEVLHLRDMCGLALVDRMTPDTACQLIDLFDQHGDSRMVELVIDTCIMHLSTHSEPDEWREEILARSKLTALVLRKLTEGIRHGGFASVSY